MRLIPILLGFKYFSLDFLWYEFFFFVAVGDFFCALVPSWLTFLSTAWITSQNVGAAALAVSISKPYFPLPFVVACFSISPLSHSHLLQVS